MQSSTRERIWHTTQWGVWMLAVSVFLNYVDRGALAIAMPQIQKELALDPENLGRLASAFFWTYALLQIPAGWLVEKYDVKWILAWGFALWSLATGLTGLASDFSALLGLRLLLGIGESVAYPAYSRVIATRFPASQRGFPNALIDAFSKMGPALSTLFGGLAVAQYGWRVFFILMGAGGLIWLVPWIMWRSQEQSPAAAPAARPSVSFLAIVSRREWWGTVFGLFAINYAWYFLIFWFPPYLVQQRGFSQERMSAIGSLPFWLLGLSSILTGKWSDQLILGGRHANVRKLFLSGGLAGVAALLLFADVPNVEVALGVVMLAGVSMGFASSNNWAVTQTLAGRDAAGRWTGLQNCAGNFAGIVSPWLTGLIVKETGSFYLAFASTSGVVICGSVLYYLLIPKVQPLEF
jgi:MFS family permease